jgi:hypothetical protein
MGGPTVLGERHRQQLLIRYVADGRHRTGVRYCWEVGSGAGWWRGWGDGWWQGWRELPGAIGNMELPWRGFGVGAFTVSGQAYWHP